MEKKYIIYIFIIIMLIGGCATERFGKRVGSFEPLQEKIDHFDINNAEYTDVLKVFGEPQAYIWGKNEYQKENLPDYYIMHYANYFRVFISRKRIVELRIEGKPMYCFRNAISVGSSLKDVIKFFGEPVKTITGGELKYEDGILYKDIDGRKGYCYWGINTEKVRMFFRNNKVIALYLTSTFLMEQSHFTKSVKITSVAPYQDIRWKDLRGISLPLDNLIKTFTFNESTIWPEPYEQSANNVLRKGMNPGLGAKTLHARGITGKGVTVAIIDQNLCLDHPEYRGKIVKYHDVGTNQPQDAGSMHAPAVASLLAGENIGTAPGANVYFAAAPSWTRDAQYQADALNWIIDENAKLPANAKIRVVSISAAPSGPGSPFTKNNAAWDTAYQRAMDADILVLDCTSNYGITAACYYDIDDPDDITRCKPGHPNENYLLQPQRIHVPNSFRTLAEEYKQGEFSYQYTGHGGLSWTIPYLTGVLAMGWQVRPDITSSQMLEILFQTAYIKDRDIKIINPVAFINAVENFGR